MNLYVDTTRGALVAGPTTTQRVSMPTLTTGDTVPITISFLQRNTQALNTGNPIYTYQDYSASGVLLSIGLQSAQPTAGTFPLTFGANTATGLAYNISSYALSVALNALASVVTAGGVAVSGNIGGPFTVTFNSNGSQSLISSGANALYPSSSLTITTDKAGTASSPAVQIISINQAQAVQVSSWTAQSAAAVTVTQISGNLIQRVTIPSGTYGGTFTLTYNGNTTAAIPFAAQLDVVTAAVNALPGITGATVWPGQNYWDISIPSGAFTLTGNASGLVIPLSISGSLPLTSPVILDLLSGKSSASVPMYIQTTTGTIQTVYVGSVTLALP